MNNIGAVATMRWEEDETESGDDCCCCEAEMTSCRRFMCSKLGKLTLFVVGVLFIFWLFSSPTPNYDTAVGGQLKPSAFNHSHAVDILNRLCDDYRAERASGDLCNRLCYDRVWDVQDFYAGNKVVFTLILGGQKVVLKSQHAFIQSFDILDDRVPIEVFTEKILELTNYQLRLGWPDDYKRHLIETLWPALFRTGNLSVADRHSLWALVSQDEYLTFKVLPLSRVFPKVMGSCGHFYAVEYLVPFRMKSYYTNLKAKILVHLMGTLKLFYEFLNEPLHWCDVKFDNFGLSAEYPKRFLIMDGDMIFTDSRMRQFLQSTKCAQDTDCHFFDCEAKCDLSTKHCTDRVNDNIDVFCKKLVTQLFGNFWTKSNRYLAACHDGSMNATERLADLRLVWSWSLSDV